MNNGAVSMSVLQSHKQANSVADLLPTWPGSPVSVQTGVQVMPGLPQQGTASVQRPRQPPSGPVRMLSAGLGTQVVADTNLSAGPQVDWNAVEERWYRNDFTEGKVRGWLATIPMSDGPGPEREWDDSQIFDLVEFAKETRCEHMAVEEIYRLYVVRQVELAEIACSSST